MIQFGSKFKICVLNLHNQCSKFIILSLANQIKSNHFKFQIKSNHFNFKSFLYFLREFVEHLKYLFYSQERCLSMLLFGMNLNL